MTSWDPNYCGPFNHRHKTHMIDVNADGNAICVRPGCNHAVNVVCTCRYEPGWTKYVGCPTHTENPRAPYPSPGQYHMSDRVPGMEWCPEDMGGDLSLEDANRFARELRRKR